MDHFITKSIIYGELKTDNFRNQNKKSGRNYILEPQKIQEYFKINYYLIFKSKIFTFGEKETPAGYHLSNMQYKYFHIS